MKFNLRLTDTILNKINIAMSKAEDDGTSDIYIDIRVNVDKKNKVIIERVDLHGRCMTDYYENIE